MTDDDVLTAVRDCLINARDSVAGEQMATRPGTSSPGSGGAACGTAWPPRGHRNRRGDGAHAAARQRQSWRRQRHHPGQAGGLDGFRQARRRVRVTIRDLRDPAACSASCAPMASRPPSGSPARSRARACTTRSLPVTPSGCWAGSSRRTARPAARLCSPSTPRRSPLRSGSGSTSARPAPSPDGTAARSVEFSASWTLVYASGRCPSSNPARGSYSGGGAGYSGEGAVSGPGN